MAENLRFVSGGVTWLFKTSYSSLKQRALVGNLSRPHKALTSSFCVTVNRANYRMYPMVMYETARASERGEYACGQDGYMHREASAIPIV